MSEKHIVVQGAICKCQFGNAPDKLKVLSHQKEYANDKSASKKRIATTKETGAATFENNSFGSCTKMGSPPPPCKPVITEWNGFYEDVVLSNGGKILLEDSKAVCAVAGTACIQIVNHGQITEPSSQNFQNADKDVQAQLNPLIDTTIIIEEQPAHIGGKDAVKKQLL